MAESEIIVCPTCGTANRVPHARLADAPTCGKCGRALFKGTPAAVDTAGFDRLMRLGTLPVLVDFWAAWCGVPDDGAAVRSGRGRARAAFPARQGGC